MTTVPFPLTVAARSIPRPRPSRDLAAPHVVELVSESGETHLLPLSLAAIMTRWLRARYTRGSGRRDKGIGDIKPPQLYRPCPPWQRRVEWRS
jgi:hypothetical protein